jgi:hypothetical protein
MTKQGPSSLREALDFRLFSELLRYDLYIALVGGAGGVVAEVKSITARWTTATVPSTPASSNASPMTTRRSIRRSRAVDRGTAVLVISWLLRRPHRSHVSGPLSGAALQGAAARSWPPRLTGL